MLKEPSGQLMVTPELTKRYSNSEFKVYQSTFDSKELIVVRRLDKAVAICLSWDELSNPLCFEYKLEAIF